MERKEVLRVEDACGRFVKADVLDHFTFSACAGELCCLYGLHNAGKTAFMQMLSGRISGAWRMRVRMNGAPVVLDSPAASAAAGIRCVWSESSLIEGLTVAENLYVVGRMAFFTPYVRRGGYEKRAREMLERYGIGDVAPSDAVSGLSPVARFLVEMVRCIQSGARVLFLDCLTAFQDQADLTRLETLLRAFAGEGGSTVLLCNRPDERLFFVDRIVVMRAGRRVKTFCREAFDPARLRRYAEGDIRGPEESPAPADPTPAGTPVCVCRIGYLGGVCELEAVSGRIIGLLCPEGGYAERLTEFLTRGRPPADLFVFEGRDYSGRRLPEAVLRKISVIRGLMPEQVLLPNFDALGNLELAAARLSGRLPRLSRRVSALLKQENEGLLAQLDAAMEEGRAEPTLNMSLETRRILLLQSRLVVVDRPMRGLDDAGTVGMRAELRRLAASGAAVVLLDDRRAGLQNECDKVAQWH